MIIKFCFPSSRLIHWAFRVIILLFLTLPFLSCETNSGKNIKEFISSYPNLYGYKYYLIVPFLGCQGCYNNAETFVINNAHNIPNVRIFIVGCGSEKVMRIRYGSEVLNLSNLVLIPQSLSNKMLIKDLQYPTLVEFKQSHINITIPSLDSLLIHLKNYDEKNLYGLDTDHFNF